GDISLPPEVTLTSPGTGSTYDEGDVVTFSADASSEHSSIERVEFFLNDSLVGSDNSAPYQHSWTAKAGNHAVFAQAIDSNQQSTKTEAVSFTVNGNAPGGSCKDLPAYTEGEAYTQGQVVTNVDNQYSCQVAGWCGGAAWAYEPGVGQYWEDAWKHEGDCGTAPELSFTSPAAGETLLAGIPTNLVVNANAGDFAITKVQFFADSQLIGDGIVDGNNYQLEWTPVTIGNTSLKAIATDEDGGEGEATQQITVTDQALVVDVTKPTPGSRFGLGTPVEMEADAKSFTSDIDRVEFL
ncbi:Ig-like domain-containing protein, partial [Photobacterium sanctipauli]